MGFLEELAAKHQQAAEIAEMRRAREDAGYGLSKGEVAKAWGIPVSAVNDEFISSNDRAIKELGDRKAMEYAEAMKAIQANREYNKARQGVDSYNKVWSDEAFAREMTPSGAESKEYLANKAVVDRYNDGIDQGLAAKWRTYSE